MESDYATKDEVPKLEYLIDENGNKCAVLIPINTWEKLNEDYLKLQKKLAVFASMQKGMSQIRKSKKTGRKLQMLADFLENRQ